MSERSYHGATKLPWNRNVCVALFVLLFACRFFWVSWGGVEGEEAYFIYLFFLFFSSATSPSFLFICLFNYFCCCLLMFWFVCVFVVFVLFSLTI